MAVADFDLPRLFREFLQQVRLPLFLQNRRNWLAFNWF